MFPPASLLTSPLFSIRETAESGRGVYASQAIAKDTLLFETTDIAAHVIYREYRKEVCAQCFEYDRGRIWKIRDAKVGVAFCSEACRHTWTHYAVNSTAAWTTVEALGKTGRAVSSDSDEINSQERSRPTEQEIEQIWARAEDRAFRVQTARMSSNPSKAARKLLTQVFAVQPLRDIVSYLFSGVMTSANAPTLWTDVLQLEPESTPYSSNDEIAFYITSYIHLLACCPPSLLPHVTSIALRTLAQNSAHNVFNIWSQDLDDGGSGGSECLGYGLWPAASYWNHNCAPNVRKRREGRMWRFWADRDVSEGEELCISYLGGDERDMTREQRMDKLKEHWKFECACDRCAKDKEGRTPDDLVLALCFDDAWPS